MQPRFILFGAGWGALVGWAFALVIALAAVTMDPGGPGGLPATLFVVIYPVVLGVPIGAASGAASGLVAAALVGPRTALPPVMFRVAIGAMAVPLVAAILLQASALILPGIVGTALLLASTPRILRAGKSTSRIH